jgi:hypothetical protein
LQQTFGQYKVTTSSIQGNLTNEGGVQVDVDIDEGVIPNLNL